MMIVKEKININTIAKLAGVSTTTVSNFINGTENFPISREKQTRIMELMREFNYRPNSSSSMIRRKKALPGKGVFIYGNFTEAPPFSIIQNPMLNRLLLELSQSVMTHFGCSLEVRPVQNPTNRDEWNETLVDAEFVISYGRLNPMLYQLVQRKNLPFVVIAETERIEETSPFHEPIAADYVYWNTAHHLRLVMEHLREQGVRRTCYISSWNVAANRGNFFAVEAETKIAAYRDYLAAHSDMTGTVVTPPLPAETDIYYEIRHTAALLSRRPELLRDSEAIVAHNDIVARGVVAAATAAGLRIGDELKVTGEGDFAEFRFAVPAVTTVTYDQAELARQVCRLLRLKRESCRYYGEKILIPSRLIVRETT